MEKAIEYTNNYKRLCHHYQVHRIVKALGKEKFGLKGRYVVLAEKPGKNGKIEYYVIPAFEDPDSIRCNDCLSKEVKEKAAAGLLQVGEIYRLHVKCRFIVSPDSHYKRCENTCDKVLAQYPRCRVGAPAMDCWKNFEPKFGEWDYNNPECACWEFNENDRVDISSLKCNSELTISELLPIIAC